MRFVADAMLGKLARWLRIIGYDTEYLPSAGDDELISAAEGGGRLLLTRDNELFRRAVRRGVPAILIKSTTIVEELSEIARTLGLRLSDQTRCPLCNELLVEGEDDPGMPARGKVWVCPRCRKFYWHGSHWLKISETLEASGLR
ncbi:MAG: Mut7-C RNAse domain-containing protein [Candidatus Methanosuratincola petrocarbonis]|nr:Mut7-C RNAse domain-containing protein [Candidatus Methanosuratincola sp.]